MGYIRAYADRINLAAMIPRADLSSTGHALAGVASADSEFLVYSPSGGNFTVNLSGVDGTLAVEWMDPAKGSQTKGASVRGGTSRAFRPPFTGDAVLYLRRNPLGAKSK